jgi:hypothetical protein
MRRLSADPECCFDRYCHLLVAFVRHTRRDAGCNTSTLIHRVSNVSFHEDDKGKHDASSSARAGRGHIETRWARVPRLGRDVTKLN